MEKLIVLGTGNAMVTACYNTCFALQSSGDEAEYLMVDAGGGNGILAQLEKAQLPPEKLHHLIVTHEHCDHVLGVVWVLRKLGTMMLAGKYEGNLCLYCQAELSEKIATIAELVLQKKFTKLFGDRILFVPVTDGQTIKILQKEVTFFDIHSTKAPQFGFTTRLQNGKILTCMGDEPVNPLCEHYAQGCDWLLSEAFCLYAQREQFRPYEKHHSTVKDACELAQRLAVKNLVLWHTEEKNLARRRVLYTEEGRAYYTGKLFVPEDLDVLEL